MLRRQTRIVARPTGWRASDPPRRLPPARPALAEHIYAELEALWGAITQRGRILDPEEFPEGLRERLRGANVSPMRATGLCLSAPSARDHLATIASARREDLVIHLAMTLFPGAPRYTTLPRSIQRDARAFFGSHAAAIQEANALLFSVGKADGVRDGITAAVAAGLGAMRDSDTFRMHVAVLNRLPTLLRVLVGCAGVLHGGTEGADFIDIKMDGRRVAFIACVDATMRLPIYTEHTRVDLGRLKVKVDQPEGMILYLKGRFLPADAEGVAEQLLFDQKLIDAGIVDEAGKGPRYAELQDIIRQRKLKRGHARSCG